MLSERKATPSCQHAKLFFSRLVGAGKGKLAFYRFSPYHEPKCGV